MALRWLIKSRGHSLVWSSHLCESHTCGHTGSTSFPKNLQLMTSGISQVLKTYWYGLLFFFFQIFVCAFSCPHLHNAFCRHQNKRRRNKNTFKERVKFPILECTAEIRETKHSRIVVESLSWLSLPWYTSSTPGMWCHCCGLRSVSLIWGKPMKMCLSFFHFVLHEEAVKKSIKKSYILARCVLLRHEWCSINIPVEGAVGLPLLNVFLEPCTTKYAESLPWYPGASVNGPFTVTEIPGDFL